MSCWETPEGIPLEGDPESLSGNCRAGVRSCSEGGVWGACEGAIAPAAEDDCTPGDDSNCNGTRNEGCSCADGDQRACGTGEGGCEKGVQSCEGSAWGECVGQVVAQVKDSCDASDDSNCNGIPNEGCACTNGATRPCGSALGNCSQGTQTCALGVWQPCQGSVEPTGADTCAAGDDSDCDGVANEGCPCLEGAQEACGSATGNCRKGTRQCVDGTWGACTGNVVPKPNDTCDSGDDSTCNGVPNEGCTCINGVTRPCGSSVGNCRQGTQECEDGNWSNICSGEVRPASKDLCTPGDDATCNGQPNEGCSCVVGEVQTCGKCGSQTCAASGWGTCGNEGACSPGQIEVEEEPCPGCLVRKRQRTCGSSCSWGAWGTWDRVCNYQTQHSKICWGGDAYWQDSCGTRGVKIEECNSASCQDGACYRDCSGYLTFDDPVFEQAVRAYAEKNDASQLHANDVANGYTGLVPSSYNITGISSIGGVECLPKVEILEVGLNSITDLSPLRKTGPQLYYVSVWNNYIYDISPLADNPYLTYVDVTSNPFDCNSQRQYLTQLESRPGAEVYHSCE